MRASTILLATALLLCATGVAAAPKEDKKSGSGKGKASKSGSGSGSGTGSGMGSGSGSKKPREKPAGQEDAKTCKRGEKLVGTTCSKLKVMECPVAGKTESNKGVGAGKLLAPSYFDLLVAGEKCNGKASGECMKATGKCVCLSGWMGNACDMSQAEIGEKREKTKEKLVSAEKSREALQAEKTKCTDKTKPVYCEDADYVKTAAKETCVASKKDCVDDTKLAEYKAAAKTRPAPPGCEAGEKRCKDGTCGDCSKATDPCKDSADGSVSCGDGITCKKTKTECRKEVKINGCEEGMIACPAKTSVCVDDVKKCKKATGCDDGKKFCGFKRGQQGMLWFDKETGQRVSNCLDACKVKPATERRLRGSGKNLTNGCTDAIAAGDLKLSDEDDTAADPKSIVQFEAPAGTFGWNEGAGGASACSGRSMPFEMKQAADTERNFGPFGKMCRDDVGSNGTIVRRNKTCASAMFVMLPPSTDELTVSTEGYVLEVDISTEETVDNQTACAEALGAMAVYTAPEDAEEDAGVREAKCQLGVTAGGCFCQVSVNHFSSYVVVDETPTGVEPDTEEEVVPDDSLWQSIIGAILFLCVACCCMKFLLVPKFCPSCWPCGVPEAPKALEQDSSYTAEQAEL